MKELYNLMTSIVKIFIIPCHNAGDSLNIAYLMSPSVYNFNISIRNLI